MRAVIAAGTGGPEVLSVSEVPDVEPGAGEVAIAVALEGQSSTGGATAAPIARTVMEALLRPPANP